MKSLMSFRIIARILSPVIIFSACTLYGYRLSTGAQLDFALVKDNIGISFSFEALQMISASFSSTDFIFIAVLLSAVIFLELKFSLFSKKKDTEWRGVAAAVITSVIIITLPV